MSEKIEPPIGVGPLVFITTTIGECIVPRAWPMQAVFSVAFLKAKAHPAFTLQDNVIKVEVGNGSAMYEYDETVAIPGSGGMVIAKLLTPTAVFSEPVTREQE